MVLRWSGPDRCPASSRLPRPATPLGGGGHRRHHLRRPVRHRGDRGRARRGQGEGRDRPGPPRTSRQGRWLPGHHRAPVADRKSTRLNSSHITISYAVFCLKKKKKKRINYYKKQKKKKIKRNTI